MKSIYFLATLLAVAVSRRRSSAYDFGTNDDNDNGRVKISSKCAAILLAGAGAVDEVETLTPTALCSAGLNEACVNHGWFKRDWYVVVPLVAKRKLSTTLQALVVEDKEAGLHRFTCSSYCKENLMYGIPGATTITMATGAVGGTLSAMLMTVFCDLVDGSDPNDAGIGAMFRKVHQTVTSAIETNIKATDKNCQASQTCTLLKRLPH